MTELGSAGAFDFDVQFFQAGPGENFNGLNIGLQLIADGLEIIEEDAIVEVLSTTDSKSLKKAKKKKRQLRESPFSKKELSRIEAAVEEALENMKPKKLKKLLKGKKVEIKIQLEDKE